MSYGRIIMLAPSHIPSQPKPLCYVNYDKFTEKLKTSKREDVAVYHGTTKYRLDIAEYCLRLLLAHYDNGVEFGAGLTGFLVQAKAALDSLSEEINLFYKLVNLQRKDWTLDIEELIDNLKTLSTKNNKLAEVIEAELKNKSKWFDELKILRDKEGVHQHRRSRTHSLGDPKHSIQIDDNEVGDYCVNTLAKINSVIETCYSLM
jgi:mannitol/fructose-specific phosphotransferase system IIA component